MIYCKNKNALVHIMNYRADMIDKQDGKTFLNFMIQVTVLKIGKYPSKIDRIIKNAKTETEGYILIESIFN